MSNTQPKISHRLMVRTLVLVLLMGGLFTAYRWAQDQRGDFDALVPANTVGMVAAIQFKDEGQQAVIFKEDGTMVPNVGYPSGGVDRDLAWSPDGNRVFFVSDRAPADKNTRLKAFNIFRWNPDKNTDPVQRTVGSRGRSNPAFPDQPDQGETALITSGGYVLEFDPKDATTRQVLPPQGKEAAKSAGDEGGTISQFTAIYGELGNSFRVAKWAKDKRFIVAVMRRDEGEVLVIQDLEVSEKTGQVPPPVPLVAGNRIDIAVSPKDGNLFFSVQDFRWPDPRHAPAQYVQGNRVTVPFHHLIAIFDFDQGMQPVAATRDDSVAFGAPAISPDGDQLAVTVGPFKDEAIKPESMVLMPAKVGGGNAPATLVRGEVYEPNWRADGGRIAYIKRDGGNRAVFTIAKDGSDERRLSKEGDFGTPLFSPQLKKS